MDRFGAYLLSVEPVAGNVWAIEVRLEKPFYQAEWRQQALRECISGQKKVLDCLISRDRKIIRVRFEGAENMRRIRDFVLQRLKEA